MPSRAQAKATANPKTPSSTTRPARSALPVPTTAIPLSPMLATTALQPPGGAYAAEYKWDGMRALAEVQPGSFHLWSRNGNEVADRFPELQRVPDSLHGRTAVLDGEIVRLDANGRPDFGLLQERIHLANPNEVRAQARRHPVRYFVFDVLVLDGERLVDLPYHERRKRLEGLGLDSKTWSTPPSHPGAAQAMLEVSRTMGLEGIVAKRLDSPYRPGERSAAWLKVRNRMRQEFVVGGWSEGEGARKGTFGALLLGHYASPAKTSGPTGHAGGSHAHASGGHVAADVLTHVGRVGSGFGGASEKRLAAALRSLASLDCPFGPQAEEELGGPGVHWVRPELVAEVEFSGLTQHGVLRQASFKGLRTDKPARDVVWEQAQPRWAGAEGHADEGHGHVAEGGR